MCGYLAFADLAQTLHDRAVRSSHHALASVPGEMFAKIVWPHEQCPKPRPQGKPKISDCEQPATKPKHAHATVLFDPNTGFIAVHDYLPFSFYILTPSRQ